MLPEELRQALTNELARLGEAGVLKVEQSLESPQGPEVVVGGKRLLMFAANNYLGLGHDPEVEAAAQRGLAEFGHGLAAVRFISGTLALHRQLELALAKLLKLEDAILYSSAFMANLGFFACLNSEGFGSAEYQDVVYSDELNHASVIDALKLMKSSTVVKRVYPHADAKKLAQMLAEDAPSPYRFRVIATDGVFSMEGDLAPLPELVALAQQYGALLMVDDAHGVGVLGEHGGGTPEHLGVAGRVDVVTGTLGKALGGALGGYVAGARSMIDFLRQKSRPYLFSNALPPALTAAALQAITIASTRPELRQRVLENARYLRAGFKRLGLRTVAGVHPIVPLMIGDAAKTQRASQALRERGVFVVGLWFPVVPEGQARLRFQVSAAHTQAQLDQVLAILQDLGDFLH